MCDAASIMTLVVSAMGTYAQQSAQKDATRRQETAINNAEEEQQSLNARRQESLLNAVNGYLDPTPAAQAQTAQEDRLEGVAADSVSAASQDRPDSGMSIDYTRDKATRTAEEARRAIQQAMQTSRAQAPQTSMFEGGLGLADDLSEVDGIASQMRSAARRSSTGIRRAGQVNQGQLALGAAISGAAGAYNGSRTPQTARTPDYPTTYGGV